MKATRAPIPILLLTTTSLGWELLRQLTSEEAEAHRIRSELGQPKVTQRKGGVCDQDSAIPALKGVFFSPGMRRRRSTWTLYTHV